MAAQQGQPEIKPTTIFRHAFAVYPPMAMIAGMQLDIFTPLKDGPMTAPALAQQVGVRVEKLRPLLYALVNAELLRVKENRFENTPEAAAYLVRGGPGYMGSAHELYSDLWSAALRTAESIRAGAPQAKHDFMAMSEEDLAAFFRGLHAGAVATGQQLAGNYDFGRFRRLLDVGGGSGGLAIAACQSCPNLRATVVELPRVAPIARSTVEQAGLADRVEVLAANVVDRPAEGRFDVTVLRFLIQVLGPDEASRMLQNVGRMIEPGGSMFIVGQILNDSRLEPPAAVGVNLAFLNIYDEGQAYTEGEHRSWLAEAGFTDVDVQYGVAPGGASVIIARKANAQL